MARPRFLSCTASGFNARSYPLEVAWSDPWRGVQTYLVMPHESFHRSGWELGSEVLHELSREQLETEGRSPEEITRELITSVNGRPVYCTDADLDFMLLRRLFEAAEWITGDYLPMHVLPAAELFATSDVPRGELMDRYLNIAFERHIKFNPWRAEPRVRALMKAYELYTGHGERPRT